MEYNKIPYFNNIFIDYIYDFDKLSSFYNGDFRRIESFHNIINLKSKNYLKNKFFNRDCVADILKEQNKFFNSNQKTFENIELLRKENTFAVVTGQQIGLLSGNLYTFYKAINTVQLSGFLSERFPEYNFVPVFWLETDDHDFSEINNINILNKENRIINLRYLPEEPEPDKYLTPVYRLDINQNFEKFIIDLKSNLNDTDFSEELFDYIERAYKPGIKLVTAFARYMNYLLQDKGLIFCNPADTEIKKILTPVFIKELNTFPKACELAIDTSAKLERKYEPQLKPKAINLFFNYNSSRYLIEPYSENQFGLKNSRKKFEKNELFEFLDNNPELFSSNVLLRPVCQDFLLPTIAYIAGPSEIAYYAQIGNVYEYFNVTMPVIYPRTTITIVEDKVSSFFKKYNLNIEDFSNIKILQTKLLKQLETVNLENIFTKYKDAIRSQAYELEKELIKVDKNLIENLKGRNDKYLESVEIIKNKYFDSQVKQNEVAASKLISVTDIIFPSGILQERFYNIVYFLNKYGMKLTEFLFEKTEINLFKHQLLYLNFKSLESIEK